MLRVSFVNTDHHKDVLEVGADGARGERLTLWLLENHRDNVVANVTLTK